jgi:general L-amino acid transport system permease protein
LVAWIRTNLFGDIGTSLGTLTIVAGLMYVLPPFLQWLLVDAVWVPNYDTCHAEGAGACWGVIAEKYRLIIFGRYPFEEQWRPLVSTLLLLGLIVVSCTRAFWKATGWLRVWVVVFAMFFTIMLVECLV